MNESLNPPGETPVVPRALLRVQLAGFSSRDRELLRLFLRRPPGSDVSLTIVDDEADLLIGNAMTPETLDLLRHWSRSKPAIGIVERFERDAPFYQVAQDSQMLFSMAQAIKRIRAGWVPPTPTQESENGGGAEIEAAGPALSIASPMISVATEALVEPVPPSPPPPPTPVPATKQANGGEATTASSIAKSAGLPWQRALNILVIDDSHFSRVAISEALIKVGFAVDTAEGGEEGLRLASEKVFDVALVDFEMPGMRGPEVLRKLRGLGAQAPSVLIMLTSRTGSVDRLRKPTKMQEFLSTLRSFAIAGKLSRP
jgi:CheY-like chemotaxis protein